MIKSGEGDGLVITKELKDKYPALLVASQQRFNNRDAEREEDVFTNHFLK